MEIREVATSSQKTNFNRVILFNSTMQDTLATTLATPLNTLATAQNTLATTQTTYQPP